jgi:hypothetical protein
MKTYETRLYGVFYENFWDRGSKSFLVTEEGGGLVFILCGTKRMKKIRLWY